MHDPQPSDDLNDDRLAREIERALAVDPSPEFVARIRTRVAAEALPTLPPWRFRWGLVTAGLAMAAGVMTMLYLGIPYTGRVPSGGLPEPQTATTAADVELSPESQPVIAAQRRAPAAEGVETAGTRGSGFVWGSSGAARDPVRDFWGFPEVIVSPAEANALRALIADAHAGRLVIMRAGGGAQPEVSSALEKDVSYDPELIVIVPLEIQPLVKAGSSEEQGEVE